MADARLLERAAYCYERAGLPAEAARCYRESGSLRRSADLYLRQGEFRQAAQDYAESGLPEQAAWILVHQCGDPVSARALLEHDGLGEHDGPGETAEAELRRQVVLARCSAAEGSEEAAAAALAAVCADFGAPRRLHDKTLEGWSVELADAIGRDDLIALVYAAAVRGGRPGAATRWDAWSRRVLGTAIILPQDDGLARTG
jgi:hypothetical protein